MLYITQIGAGGTGSWFAASLARTICQYHDKYGNGIILDPVMWTVIDYDTIEKRNLLRQPFIGGIGLNKAEFLVNEVQQIFAINGVAFNMHALTTMVRGAVEQTLCAGSWETEPADTDIRLIVSCVDNTYTRKIIEECLAKHRPKNTWYLNMGVSAEGDWYAERISAQTLLPTAYDSITYPDAMLSCGQRAEMTPMPQTMHSNVQAGDLAAHMIAMLATDILTGRQPDEILCVAGKGLESHIIPAEEYLDAHAADLAAAAMAPRDRYTVVEPELTEGEFFDRVMHIAGAAGAAADGIVSEITNTEEEDTNNDVQTERGDEVGSLIDLAGTEGPVGDHS
jgi:hypothetical protein